MHKAIEAQDRADARFNRLVTASLIRKSLFEQGCKPKMLEMATAVCLKRFPIELSEVDGEPQGVVVTNAGKLTIETAIAGWLATDEGSLCAPAKPTLPGIFATAIPGRTWRKRRSRTSGVITVAGIAKCGSARK